MERERESTLGVLYCVHVQIVGLFLLVDPEKCKSW